MPVFEIGIFIITLGFAFIFSFVPFNTGNATKGFLHVIGMILFVILGIISMSGYEISGSSTITDGTTTWTEKRILISEGESGAWLGYLFYGFAVMNLVFFVRDVFKGE